MLVARHIPTTALRPFIKHLMIIESRDGMQNTILPDTSLVIALRLSGQVSTLKPPDADNMPSMVITGLRRSARLLDYAKRTATLLVVFHEAGPTAFFDLPMHELFDRSVALDNLIARDELAQLEDQLLDTTTSATRFALVEKFFLAKLRNKNPDALVLQAIQSIKQAQGKIHIKSLASVLNISIDPFEKRFRKATGTSPKQFSSIVRLRTTISNFSGTGSLTELAYSAGYFDQAHFIKDFKAFTGQTPQAFFHSARYW